MPYGADRGIYEHLPFFSKPFKNFVYAEAVAGQVYRAKMPDLSISIATSAFNDTITYVENKSNFGSDTGESLWKNEGVLDAHKVSWEVDYDRTNIAGFFMSYEMGNPQHDKWLFRQPLLIASESVVDVDKHILAIPIGSVRRLRVFNEQVGKRAAFLENALEDGLDYEEEANHGDELLIISRTAATGLDNYLMSEYVSQLG